MRCHFCGSRSRWNENLIRGLFFNNQMRQLAPLRIASRVVGLNCMDGQRITTAQTARLRQLVARNLRFLSRLCGRMARLGFPPADPLYRAALNARNAVQGLHVESHYASCKGGVGR